jgi:hypothetical protein
LVLVQPIEKGGGQALSRRQVEDCREHPPKERHFPAAAMSQLAGKSRHQSGFMSWIVHATAL